VCADAEVRRRAGDNLVDSLLESFEGLSAFPQIETSFYTTTYMTGMLSVVFSIETEKRKGKIDRGG
jgi:hypothetical protein